MNIARVHYSPDGNPIALFILSDNIRVLLRANSEMKYGWTRIG